MYLMNQKDTILHSNGQYLDFCYFRCVSSALLTTKSLRYRIRLGHGRLTKVY